MSSNECHILGYRVSCVFSEGIPQKRSAAKKPDDSAAKNIRLSVCNLNALTKEKKLKEFFSKFGKVKVAYIAKMHKTKISKGYGYIVFFNNDSLLEVLRAEEEELRLDEYLLQCSIFKKEEAPASPAQAHLPET